MSTLKGERVVYLCSVYFVSIKNGTIFSRVILSCKKFFVSTLFTKKWMLNKSHYRFFLLKEKAAFCHSWSKIFPPWEVSSSCYPICPVNFFCWMKKEAPSLFLETFKSPLKKKLFCLLSILIIFQNLYCFLSIQLLFSEFILFSFYPVNAIKKTSVTKEPLIAATAAVLNGGDRKNWESHYCTLNKIKEVQEQTIS